MSQTNSNDSIVEIVPKDVEFPIIVTRTNSKRVPLLRRSDSRVVSKSGRTNITLKKLPEKSTRYLKDLWTTLVQAQWRYTLLTIALVNLTGYCLIGALFLLDSWISGDFSRSFKPDSKSCMIGIRNMRSFFMIGIETLTTTGYGYIYPTENCNLVFIILSVSILITVVVDGVFISVVYAKIGKPSRKQGYAIFSKKSVVTLRDGKLCFIFRINDYNGMHWMDTKVKVYLIKNNSKGFENQDVDVGIEQLKLEPFGALMWPTDLVHIIDSSSPLYHYSAQDFFTDKFEIVCEVVGTSIHTSQQARSQTSYVSSEVMWGYRFSSCLRLDFEKRMLVFSKKLFNYTMPYDTPLCSGRLLDELQEEMKRNSGDCFAL